MMQEKIKVQDILDKGGCLIQEQLDLCCIIQKNKSGNYSANIFKKEGKVQFGICSNKVEELLKSEELLLFYHDRWQVILDEDKGVL